MLQRRVEELSARSAAAAAGEARAIRLLETTQAAAAGALRPAVLRAAASCDEAVAALDSAARAELSAKLVGLCNVGPLQVTPCPSTTAGTTLVPP